ncbi:MAG TPA: FlgD immunoglobulin-like domain containing protein [Candidatus Krumholzibacteria bacterium]|nr:FlgD immunoglobulin-like domain containing protein [Candidatus Krumholzibacteria bacterium]
MHPCTTQTRACTMFAPALVVLSVLAAAPVFAAHGDITLVGQIKPFSSNNFTNVWGFERDGRAYAVIGDWDSGPVIIDVTDPTTPFVRKIITGSGVFGFDVKVWGNYIYTCEGRFGAPLASSRAIDISNMDSPIISPAFVNVHAFSVHPSGYLFAEIPGLRIFDLNADPTPSAYLWYDGDLDYGHDSTVDVEHNRLYDFHGPVGTKVWDISNFAAPVLLRTITDPTITYHHSGDATENGQYLFLCDELAVGNSKDCTVWDIAATPPQKVGIGLHDPTATIHNLYIIGNFAFVSHYTAGFRVYDVSNPLNPVLLDTYDTAPALSGDGYNGCYGVYPFGPGGIVYVSDDDNGLFLFQVEDFSGAPTAIGDTPPASSVRLLESYPNPFNPATTIAYEIERAADVTLAIYDIKGGLVRTLTRARIPGGRHEVRWDGARANGDRVASGVYFVRLTANGRTDTGRLVLLK